MNQVQALDKQKKWSELSLVLLDDRGITEINKTYLGKQNPTDVISFAYPPPVPEHTQGYIGEVFVNIECAFLEGNQRNGHDHELALYIAHGCHHLMGATDHTPSKRNQMLRVETNWLQQAEAQGSLKTLIKG